MLRLEVEDCEYVGAYITRLASLAREAGAVVLGEHNGTPITAYPGADEDDLFETWYYPRRLSCFGVSAKFKTLPR